MHLICPHCQDPIELVTLPASSDVLCAVCGSTFRVDADATVTWSGTSRGGNLGRFERHPLGHCAGRPPCGRATATAGL